MFRIRFPGVEITDERRWVKLAISTLGETAKLDVPPARVAAEKGHVAALSDERFDVRAHLLAPVLVMTDTEQETVRRKEATLLVQVEISAVIHPVMILFHPGDERNVPVCECLARRSGIVKINAARNIVARVEVWDRAARSAAGSVNAHFINSLFRDRVFAPLAHIEVAAARVVVRVICCQGQLVKNLRVLSG